MAWKHIAFELMVQYVKRTQGSFIENKGSALVWQYDFYVQFHFEFHNSKVIISVGIVKV